MLCRVEAMQKSPSNPLFSSIFGVLAHKARGS